MLIRADNDPRYSWKFLIMGIVAIGFALYCLYDGMIGYPTNRVRGFEEFKTDYKAQFDDPAAQAMSVEDFEAHADKERRGTWAEYSHERGIKAHADVVMQFIMAAITGTVGLFLISIPLRSRGRWIEMDDSGVRSSWGQGFQFDQVELLNKRKWRDKGIAKVAYRDGTRKRRFVIDDFKFKRDPTDAILFELEQRIGIEKITGGPPEPLPEPVDSDSAALHASLDDAPETRLDP